MIKIPLWIRMLLFNIKSKAYWTIWGWLNDIKVAREEKQRRKDGYWS